MTSLSIVTVLILGLLCPCSADIIAPGPPRDVNDLTLEVNELEENLAINQLAILHLLNRDPSDTMCERKSTMESEVQEELRHLREVVEECTTLREYHIKVQEDLRHLREVVEELRDHMKWKNFVDVGKFFHHEGKDFYVNKEQKMNWTDSRKWCQVRGGDLAQPTGDLNAFKQQVLQLILPNVGSASYEGAWIGGSDIAREGQWIWLSGTQLPNNFPWSDNQPNNSRGNEDCLEIYYKTDGTNNFYNDGPCTYPKYFVCEL